MKQKNRLLIGLKTNIKTVMKKKFILTSTIITIILILIAMAALVESYTTSEVEKAFTDNDIVPDILNVAPKKVVNVSGKCYLANKFEEKF